MRTSNRKTQVAARRRGVLLLVVLSLLVLFALIGVTFVLVAGQHLRAVKMEVKSEQYGDDPRRLCDTVFAQCIRDTNDPNSVLRTHSLLADMYGNDGVRGTVASSLAVRSETSSELVGFVDLTVTTPIASMFQLVTQNALLPPVDVVSQPQINTPGYFNGCVLTMLDGLAANKSTRIVGWAYVGSTYTIRVMAFEGVDPTAITGRFIVNGRPFNGTGAGYNANSGVNFATDPTLLSADEEIVPASGTPLVLPYALLPNPVHADPDKRRILKYMSPGPTTANSSQTTYFQFGGIGGADEGYDAADSQNMLLAYSPLRPNGTRDIIPSLHRPDTLAWLRRPGGPYDTAFPATPNPADFPAKKLVDRQMVLRPLPADHPLFPPPPGNAGTNLLTGPYDVDNTGDGIRDSIWVDAGLPVRVLPDGRTVKPMVAIHCIDLDGRLNVNAQGNIAQVDSFFTGGPSTPSSFQTAYQSNFPPQCYSTSGSLPNLPRGSGYGPAEVSLYPLFEALGSPMPATPTGPGYANLLASRYQEPNTTLTTTNYLYTATPKTSPYPGITGVNDPLSDLRFTAYANQPGALSSFSSAHNLSGRGFTFLDVRGTPFEYAMGTTNDLTDDPYELDLSRRTVRASTTSAASSAAASVVPTATTPNPHDSPFTPAELESVLRMYDTDAIELPSRLRTLLATGGGPTLAVLRNMVTTEGFDLPSPNILPTRAERAVATATYPLISQNISDLLRLRLIQGMGLTLPLTPPQEIQVNDAIKTLLPWEIAAGQRLDINRPFGNGYDDDSPSDGIVDEPDETPGSEVWLPSRLTLPAFDAFKNVLTKANNGINVDFNGSGLGAGASTDKKLARQLFARHLFVMLMLLNDGRNIDFDGQGGNDGPAETAQGLAQWAINVVDFRDRDSIMTPFEYNVNPFEAGWTANQDLAFTNSPQEAVVWGCERPELLLSETLAFHDVRTEDLDNPAKTTTDPDPAMRDNDFDQRLLPRGSLFVELYNPWLTQSCAYLQDGTPNSTGYPDLTEVPGELYNMTDIKGVVLDKTDPVGNTPVWRLLIVTPTPTSVDPLTLLPRDPDDPVYPPAVTDYERSIYFVNPQSAIATHGLTNHGKPYFPSGPVADLLPGRYGVVGSAGIFDGTNSYITTIGREATSPPSAGMPDTGHDEPAGITATTRRIVLTPNIDASMPQVQVVGNGQMTLGSSEPLPADIQPAIAIVIDRALDGGAPVERSVSISEPVGGYPNVPSRPANVEAFAFGGISDPPYAAPATNPRAKFIYLQRLADPTQAYDAKTNPYRTIDRATVPLVVFNGVATTPEAAPPPGLASTQRGLTQAQLAYFWGYEIGAVNSNSALRTAVPAPPLPTLPPTQHNFDYYLYHSLGFLNHKFGTAGNPASTYTSADMTMPQSYRGAPKGKPFPWFTWNNRPFSGPMELLLVPRSRSSQLLVDYQAPVLLPFGAVGGHLHNFFQIPPTGGSLRNPSPRIFEYLQVPSPFAGTGTELPPDPLQQYATSQAVEESMISHFHPPFSRVSNYRDPGRVNINTIPSDDGTNATSSIWNGIINATPGNTSTPFWPSVFASRLGTSSYNPAAPTVPSLFGNPFRSADGAALTLPGAFATKPEEVSVTFMRGQDPTGANLANDQQLFNYLATAGTPPLGSGADDHRRNPYFRFQNLQRVSNLLTTRSNVYAIWITVGYFEVYPAPVPGTSGVFGIPSATYPDGYTLGPEVGSDTGEVKRHRAFYLYDRSIPVGFEPGRDHNIDEGILVKRFIE